MTTEQVTLQAGMAVRDAERRRVGHVTDVGTRDFTLRRLTGETLLLPVGTLDEVCGDHAILTLSAEHLESISRAVPAVPVTPGREPRAADGGPPVL